MCGSVTYHCHRSGPPSDPPATVAAAAGAAAASTVVGAASAAAATVSAHSSGCDTAAESSSVALDSELEPSVGAKRPADGIGASQPPAKKPAVGSTSSSAAEGADEASVAASQVLARVTAAAHQAKHGSIPKSPGCSCPGRVRLIIPLSPRVPRVIVIIDPHEGTGYTPVTNATGKRPETAGSDAVDLQFMAHPWVLINFFRQWMQPGRRIPFDLLAKGNIYLKTLQTDLLEGAKTLFFVSKDAPPHRLRGPLRGTTIDHCELLARRPRTGYASSRWVWISHRSGTSLPRWSCLLKLSFAAVSVAYR